jgi:hypothetical protein
VYPATFSWWSADNTHPVQLQNELNNTQAATNTRLFRLVRGLGCWLIKAAFVSGGAGRMAFFKHQITTMGGTR